MDYINDASRNIQSLFYQIVSKADKLKAIYGWENTDARVTILNKIGCVLSAANTGYFLMNTQLNNIDWWKQFDMYASERNIKRAFWDFERFFQIGIVNDIFSCVESSFRIYARTLGYNGRPEFKNIYTWLLDKTDLQENISLLELLRNVRNTMHNNGTFMPTNGINQTVSYRGISYIFNNGEAIRFMTIELIISLIADLAKLVEDIVTSTPLTSIDRIEELNFGDYPE